MNKAQKFLLDEKLGDLALTNTGKLPNIYASDAMIKFAQLSVCKHCVHFEEHENNSNYPSDGFCNNRSIFVEECDYDFGCNKLETS